MSSATSSATQLTVKQPVSRYVNTNKLILILMALPGIVCIIIFAYIPLAGWAIAFFDYRPGLRLFDTPFTGFKFFELAFTERSFPLVMRNTLVLGFMFMAVTPVPMFLAILISEIKFKKFKSIVQTAFTLPNFISWIVVYAVFFAMFSTEVGLVNSVLLRFNLIETPVSPLTNLSYAWTIQTLLHIWKVAGFTAIIYLASIAGIDPELYNAASVDGAGRLQKIRHVTLPGLSSTYINMLLISSGFLLSNGFEQFFIFQNLLNREKLDVLDVYIYRVGMVFGDFPLSTALGMSRTIVSIIILFTVNWISKKVRGSSII